MTTVRVRVVAPDDTNYDWYIGPPADCPPLPPPGSFVKCAGGEGFVRSTEYSVDELHKRKEVSGPEGWDTTFWVLIHLSREKK